MMAPIFSATCDYCGRLIYWDVRTREWKRASRECRSVVRCEVSQSKYHDPQPWRA